MKQLDSFVDGIARRLSESDRLLSYGSCRRGVIAVLENLFGPDVRSYKPSDQHLRAGSKVQSFYSSYGKRVTLMFPDMPFNDLTEQFLSNLKFRFS